MSKPLRIYPSSAIGGDVMAARDNWREYWKRPEVIANGGRIPPRCTRYSPHWIAVPPGDPIPDLSAEAPPALLDHAPRACPYCGDGVGAPVGKDLNWLGVWYGECSACGKLVLSSL